MTSAAKAAIGERVRGVFYQHRRRSRDAAESRHNSRMKTLAPDALLCAHKCGALIYGRSGRGACGPQTTDSRHNRQASPNLLLGAENVARGPREVIVGDITYLPTWRQAVELPGELAGQVQQARGRLGGGWFDGRRFGDRRICQSYCIGQR